jgi:hypothetical protein
MLLGYLSKALDSPLLPVRAQEALATEALKRITRELNEYKLELGAVRRAQLMLSSARG